LRPSEVQADPEWSIEAAEELIGSLTGVLSSRIVSRPGGEIEEVHVLTSDEVSPKQTVRNVESALLAHFELAVDHRKISVAQTSRPIPLTPPTEGSMAVVVEAANRRAETRILFRGHQLETEGGHRVRVTVSVEWRDKVHEGTAVAADLPRNRLEAAAQATLRAVEAMAQEVQKERDESAFTGVSLSLDGVKLVEAFDNSFALVVVNAMAGRDVLSLTGSCQVGRNLERAVVLSTLQATDRWVRGRIS
jgi:hypothetical protein